MGGLPLTLILPLQKEVGSLRERMAKLEGKMDVLIGVCLLFIHPRAPNLIGLRSPGTMSA